MTDARALHIGPDVVDVEPGTAAVAWARVTFAEIPAHQRSAIARVDEALRRAGLPTGGSRLTFSRSPQGGTLDIAPGRMIAPFAGTLDGATVEPIPAGRAAHLCLRGPHAGLAQAWRALGEWIALRGLEPKGPCWEVYTYPDTPETHLHVMLG